MRQENKKGKRRAVALVILLFGSFKDILDTMVINIAVPSIQSGLNASSSAVEWTANAHILGMALFVITGGRLGDIFDRKKIFLLGMAGLTITSAVSGFVPTINILIFARALQGIMAAIIVPQVLSYIRVLFSPEERAGALGVYSGISGFATVAGPILGAFLIRINFFNGIGVPYSSALMIVSSVELQPAKDGFAFIGRPWVFDE